MNRPGGPGAERIPARTLTEVEHVAPWLRAHGRSSVAVVVDTAVTHSALTDALCHSLGSAGVSHAVTEVAGPGTLVDALALDRLLEDRHAVIACGGGATMDRAKAALAARALVEADAGSAHAVPRPGPMRVTAAAALPLVAVPTTLGTGSERSANAVVDWDGDRVLVSGPALVPALVVHDERATRELPTRLVAAGAFEALARCLGPLVGSAGTPAADELAAAVAGRIAVLGDRCGDPAARSDEHTWASIRTELARLSALGHTAALHAGRSPFAFAPWYVGHELATCTGQDKVSVLARLLPAVWSELLSGEIGWGDPARLRTAWEVVGTARGVGSSDPVTGLLELVEQWGLSTDGWVPIDRDALTRRIMRRWSDGIPHLAAVPEPAVRRVVGLAAVRRTVDASQRAG